MKTKNHLNIALTVVLTLAATPVVAGTVYVPLVADRTVAGHLLETEVRATNTDDEFIHGFTTLFIPTHADGTTFDRETDTNEFFVTQGSSITLDNLVPAGQSGILEITADPEIAITSRLVTANGNGPDHLGSELELVTSSNILSANQTAHLLGWSRTAQVKRTDFHIVNLGGSATECSVTLRSGQGNALLSNVKLNIAALSHAPYNDALAVVGQSNAQRVSASVTCDQRFYTFLTVHDLVEGEILFVGPAATGASTLTPAGPNAGPEGCDAAALFCFTKPGDFYIPTPGQSVLREPFPIPTGSYAGLHFRVEVFHGGWKQPQSGLHSLYWLALDRHFRLIAFSGFHGPGAQDILFRHGMNLDAGSKPKFVVPFRAEPGTTYVVDLVWDPSRDYVEQKILDTSGNILSSIVDAPNVNRMHVEDGEDLRADFSTAAGQNPNEPPTYGWRYSNLLLEVFP